MNVFDGVKILGYEVLNPRQVVITIDTSQYPSLKNPAMIKAGMKVYTQKHPAIDNWKAALQDDLLSILVTGNINADYTIVNAEQVDEEKE